MKDFTPTKETISLHGLGFIQLILPNDQRMHVWHPDLPRRNCYKFSSIHNHRFGFVSRVVKGKQVNHRCAIEIVKPGTGSHILISHNGPRSEKGGRESYPVADVNVHDSGLQEYSPGQSYQMSMLEFHTTPNSGIVITIMQKLSEGIIHANSVIESGHEFHYDFNRFQLSPDELYAFVVDAFKS